MEVNMATGSIRRFMLRASCVAVCVASLLVSGCSEKIYSDPQMTAQSTEVTQTVTELTYESVKARIDQFTIDINSYMNEHRDEATVNNVTGTSPAGNSANCVYTVSADGTYRSLQMFKEDDTKVVIDEYYDLGDALFIAHTVNYVADNSFDPVVKYYITGGIVYKLDRDSETLLTVADMNTQDKDQLSEELDMYLSFEDITAIYG